MLMMDIFHFMGIENIPTMSYVYSATTSPNMVPDLLSAFFYWSYALLSTCQA
jgi:hypothetical protein